MANEIFWFVGVYVILALFYMVALIKVILMMRETNRMEDNKNA